MVVDVISRSVLPAIADIEADLFETPLSLSALERLFDGPAFISFASFENGVLCGYVLAHLTQDQVEILSLGTARGYQRRGHANLLLAAVISATRDATCFLEVAADNEAALGLYRKNGFAEAGRRPRYYRRGQGGGHGGDQVACDALVMRRG